MVDRKALGTKLRFEVFKRDKFTCQYCGKISPNVVLEVDHIDPVSKGGDNSILNLITSCFDCNSGKSNIELDDDSVVIKQRLQLELLQERREQIEMMFNWKKELLKLDDDILKLIVNYIEDKIYGFKVNEKGLKKILPLAKKFAFADILESIDISENKYLRYNSDGDPIPESVEEFFNKIGGILVNKFRPPIQQKISYIKGICRKRLSYWNEKTGSTILSNYVAALKNYGWNEEQILKDLENEVIPKTIESKNWTEWRNFIEKWTEDIKGWDRNSETPSPIEIDNTQTIESEEYTQSIESIYLSQISEASERHAILSKNHFIQNMKWNLENAKNFCKNKEEIIFLLSWIEILERYKVEGEFINWVSLYYIIDPLKNFQNATLSQVLDDKYFHHLFESETISQLDLIYPQQQVGPFKADFLLVRLKYGYKYNECSGDCIPSCQEFTPIAIECKTDTSIEKTEEEIENEYFKDAFFKREGYDLIRFNQSEILSNPMGCAQKIDNSFR